MGWTDTWLRAQGAEDLVGLDAVALRSRGTVGALAADLSELEQAMQQGGRGATAFDLTRALKRPLLPPEQHTLASGLTWAVPPDGQPSFETDDTAIVLSDAWAVCLDSARLNAFHREGTLHLVAGTQAREIEREHARYLAGEGSDWFRQEGEHHRLHEELYFRDTPSVLDDDLAVLFHRRDGGRELRVAVGADGLAFFGALLAGARRTVPAAALRARFEEGPWRMVTQLLEAGVLEVVPRTAPPTVKGGRVRLLAHSALLFETETTRLLVDPMLTVRARPTFDPMHHLDAPVDAVAITHAHWDHFNLDGLMHLDRDVVVLLPAQKHRRSIVNADMVKVVQELGFTNVVELAPWAQHQVGDLVFTAVPYFGEGFGHECPRDWMTFHVQIAGRTVLGLVDAVSDAFGSMDTVVPEVFARFGAVDVLFAPCSGFRFPTNHFTRRPFALDGPAVPFTGGPDDVVRWARLGSASMVVPYALFHTEAADVEHDTLAADTDPFRDGTIAQAAAALGDRLCVLRPGEAVGWGDVVAPWGRRW